MNVKRTAQAVSFNTGISMAEYNEMPAGLTRGQTQGQILPGSTTVSAALDAVFPKDPTVSGQLQALLAAAGNSLLLRTPNGFHLAARKALTTLRGKKSETARKAADEIEALLADTELLDFYRASLLET